MEIPYVSQTQNRPRNDCGPACLLMFSRALGKDMRTTVESVSREIDPEDDGTTLNDLVRWLVRRGFTPIVERRYPYIALVQYERLPVANRLDPRGRFKHWIVRLSDDSYHDPYHHGQAGKGMRASKSELDNAEIGVALTLKEFSQMPGAYAREPYSRRYLIGWRGDQRWPQYPSLSESDLTLMDAYRRKHRFTLGDSFDDAGLDVVTKDGRRGEVYVELWGWPQDGQVRSAYEAFFRQHYPHAIVIFKEISELRASQSPPTFRISASAEEVDAGSEVTVSWETANVAKAFFSSDGDGLPPNWNEISTGPGSRRFTVSKDTRFGVKVLTHAGSELSSFVTVRIRKEKAPVYDIAVNPAQIGYGGSVTVSWYVENVRAAYLNGVGITGPRGQKTYTGLTGNTTFILGVETKDGRMLSKSATVTVTGQPGQTPAPGNEPASRLLGWNVTVFHNKAEEAYSNGCRAFLWMEGHQGAVEFKQRHPDAIVIYRKWIEHGVRFTTGQDLARYVGVSSPLLIYMGYNEADQFGQGGADLVRRLEQDIEAAHVARSVGAFWIAGTFSMGTPDFTDDSVCRIIREIAAPAYNSGLMGFDMHLYSPNPHDIYSDDAVKWFERRWEFLFTKCGFDPSVRNIYCTETGIDQPGVGGFPAHNLKDEEIMRWMKRWLSVSRAPLIIGGKSYPSPLRAACVFQAGDYGRWAGYECSRYLPIFREVWQG